ncbi:MAG TPA: hypothetical protein VE978_25515 [Chitinophagales bacterium]|nr:hypothetical protein [Chitinophagales bacterium]
MVNRAYITIIGLLFWLTSFSQIKELHEMDIELTEAFKSLVSADYQLPLDSLATTFKNNFQRGWQILSPSVIH